MCNSDRSSGKSDTHCAIEGGIVIGVCIIDTQLSYTCVCATIHYTGEYETVSKHRSTQDCLAIRWTCALSCKQAVWTRCCGPRTGMSMRCSPSTVMLMNSDSVGRISESLYVGMAWTCLDCKYVGKACTCPNVEGISLLGI